MATRSAGSLLLLALLALLAHPDAARASNGPALTTVGSKGPVSLPVDGDANTMFRMPSSIAWSLQHRIDLDMFWFQSTSRMRNTLNNYESMGGTPGGGGGFVLSIGRPDLETGGKEWDTYTDANKFTFGVGIHVDMAGGGGSESNVRLQTYPDTIGVGTGITWIAATFAGAYTFTDWLALGLSLHAIYATVDIKTLVGGDSTPLEGSPRLPGGSPFPGNPTYSDILDIFSNDEATDPTTFFEGGVAGVHFSGTVSLSFRPSDSFGIGFSYRPRSTGPALTGEGEVDASRTFSEALDPLPAILSDFFLATLPNEGRNGFLNEYEEIEVDGLRSPRQIRLSVAVWPTDWLLIAGEVAWFEWHRAFRTAIASLKKGKNEDVNFVIGNDSVDSKLTLRFRNQWVFSLYSAIGVTDDFTLRLGFNYGRSPLNVDEQGVGPSSGYTDTHVMFGASYRIGMVELHTLVEHAFHGSAVSDLTPDVPTARETYYSSRQWFIHLGVSITF